VEKESALENLQREWTTRVADLKRQLTEKESAVRDLQLELDSLKKERRAASEDEGQPLEKKG
jgi:hypothetical protein